MFIKLTRLDNSPIWFNASFIVTVEPRKGGGTTVVPIGDGLDYDVRETPEAVLSLLAGASAPATVAVQSSDALAPTAGDVSPDDSAPIEPVSRWAASKAFGSRLEKFQTPRDEPEPPPAAPAAEEASTGESGAKKARKTVRRTRTAKTKGEDSPDDAADGAEAPKKKRATRRTRAADAETPDSAPVEPAPAAPDPVAEPEPVDVFSAATSEVTVPGLTPDQLSRLRKMMPGSMRKLRNTLDKQFSIAPAYSDEVIDGLVSSGLVAFERDHVIWR